ncbi:MULTISPECIES: hypothetical protein [Photorhabdus]|uniref:hypothetical protein n=1 Tax=Photorhabdus TaxID=29487 RepID=UPI001475590C|nr:hypothetical protein [Photorhabdus asymbiotica]
MTGVRESSQQSSNLKDEGYSECLPVGLSTWCGFVSQKVNIWRRLSFRRTILPLI